MSRRFVCDVHLPPKLVCILSEHGHQAEHCFLLGLAAAADIDVWSYAKDRGAVILTKDADFAALATSRPGPSVTHIRLGNCGNAVLISQLIEKLPEILKLIDSGQRLVELT